MDRTLEYLYLHVLLPKRVSGCSDESTGDQALIDLALRSARACQDLSLPEHKDVWSIVCWNLETCRELHANDQTLFSKSVQDALQALQPSQTAILHLGIQNSALLVTREEEHFYIESFEASPPSAIVLAAQAALVWDFPSRAIRVPVSIFSDMAFLTPFTEFLEKASLEPIQDFAATAMKAGAVVSETRDSTNPALIGQLLMAILEANGSKAKFESTRKRVYDEVCWAEGTVDPWRRSPRWLVLRVSLQRALSHLSGAVTGQFQYKAFTCVVFSLLCQDLANHSSSLEILSFARKRLGRRAAKIQMWKSTGALTQECLHLLGGCEGMFKKTLDDLTAKVQQIWTTTRQQVTKVIRPVPRFADAQSTQLSFTNSGESLLGIVAEVLYSKPFKQPHLGNHSRRKRRESATAEEQSRDIKSFSDFLNLADMEHDLRFWLEEVPKDACEDRCVELLKHMQEYLDFAQVAYRSDPVQRSLMLLLLMELWQALDTCAVRAYPLLAEYNHEFPPDLMHVLNIARLSDMERLQKVEVYLRKRSSRARKDGPGIFGDLTGKSFQVRYFDRCESMQAHMTSMKVFNETNKEQKRLTWENKSQEYSQLSEEALRTPCLYKAAPSDRRMRIHDEVRCRRCYLNRKAKRVTMTTYESVLPPKDIQAKTLVFELCLPKGFAAWRDATWLLLSLGRTGAPPDQGTMLRLNEIPSLHQFIITPVKSYTVGIASSKKPFRQTHYGHVKPPIPFKKICHPHGSRYGLLDLQRRQWTSSRNTNVSFTDICVPFLSRESPYSFLQNAVDPSSEGEEVTHNMVIARQAACPNTLSAAEYISFQALSLGSHIQWLQLNRELASNNLNFGAVEICDLVTKVANQAGPTSESSVLRASHWVFEDPAFIDSLVAQIQVRLEAIAAHWRSSQSLQCLMVIIERIWYLSPSKDQHKSRSLLLSARALSQNWIKILRREMSASKDVSTSSKRAQDAFHAALLCRRTFILEAATPHEILHPDALACFLECAFTLSESLPLRNTNDLFELKDTFRRLYVADIKLVRSLEATLKTSIKCHQHAISEAVNSVLGGIDGDVPTIYASWTVFPEPNDEWVMATSSASKGRRNQEVLFNIVTGSLLVGGEPVGLLPEDYSSQPFFRRFFGDRIFRTYPSNLPGMLCRLALPFEKHDVHFGFRGEVPIMRVITRDSVGSLLEYVPPEVFRSRADTGLSDLPEDLMIKHVHWLNVSSRSLIIRPEDTMWRSKDSNWVLNLKTWEAKRRRSLLVDPRSRVFQTVASIFEPFEYRDGLLLYQPAFGNLAVQLPKFELTFRVDSEGLLECDQLKSVIDNNQDAGTLYGLKSSIVLREKSNPRRRSILVVMGKAQVEQHHGHPEVVIVNRDGYYARFYINEVLGRLECACEPRLIYFKAYCHAVTAAAMPDCLTGRTGIDEAIRCLRAGIAQPWAPFDPTAHMYLHLIADLTPQRSYYPCNLKVLQEVMWMDNLGSYNQDENLRPLVNDIIEQCSVLEDFSQQAGKLSLIDVGGETDLLERAKLRFRRFEPRRGVHNVVFGADGVYHARDGTNTTNMQRAFEAASLLGQWRECRCSPAELESLFQAIPLVQGFGSEYKLHLLCDQLQTDVLSCWGSLFTLCRNTGKEGRYSLIFLLSTLAFSNDGHMEAIRCLIMVAIHGEFKEDPLPLISIIHQYHAGEEPTLETLLSMCEPFRTPYIPDRQDPDDDLQTSEESGEIRMIHEEQSEQSSKDFATHLLKQWPVGKPTIRNLGNLPLFSSKAAFTLILEEWDRLYNNRKFDQHLAHVQSSLLHCRELRDDFVNSIMDDSRSLPLLPQIKLILPTAAEMYANASELPHVITPGEETVTGFSGIIHNSILGVSVKSDPASQSSSVQKQSSMEHDLKNHLSNIIDQHADCANDTRRVYADDLRRSLKALVDLRARGNDFASNNRPEIDAFKLHQQILLYSRSASRQFKAICDLISSNYGALKDGGLLPALTPTSLLELLRSDTDVYVKSQIRKATMSYGMVLRTLQLLLRIETALKSRDQVRLEEETWQDPDTGCLSAQNIDWFLLEIDCDLRIRKDQYAVAQAMIATNNSTNFVLQMNMGQGKSSVVIPMIMAQLANTENLARVIVPRSLLLQTAQVLQGRLGGLLDRRVKHVPFSRKSSTTQECIETYFKIHNDVRQSGGLILTLPEHVLSFKLSGLQELSNGHHRQADLMMQVQAWLDSKCKDVLDECDHMLAVRTQLIYPSGARSVVDGHPRRWTAVQDMMKLSKSLIKSLKRDFPKDVEIIQRAPGTFPTVYLLNHSVRDAYTDRLVQSILGEGSRLLSSQESRPRELRAIRSFLCDTHVSSDVVYKTNGFCQRTDCSSEVLILRGLVAHQILLLGLSKRWNVQYGVHPGRNPIAVPFRSKGIPSDHAEFGHPDLSIVLTCLSFYYSGLSTAQFQQSLAHLLRSDEPSAEFQSWVREVESFPDSLRAWSSINVEDEPQVNTLFDLLHLQMPVVNYFLNHFVFPQYARTFARKLVSSAWDIALPNNQGGENPDSPGCSNPLTVGFSGTNDNKILLPLNVAQNDLPDLAHTNAEVLTTLLQPRNRKYVRAADGQGRRISETEFLNMLKRHGIRMLIDAGAQILEFDNESLVETWLTIDTKAEAGVYFDQGGRARVLLRGGNKKSQPLSASPFLDNLAECVVYLDEAHTRGVDLKMPADARAALTLGITQSKDHTVQGMSSVATNLSVSSAMKAEFILAAMRLRKLAISQSVVFFAPPEVHQSILNHLKKTDTEHTINSYDVISWLLEQTCSNLDQLQSLYISQGFDYCRRQASARINPQAATSPEQRDDYLQVLEQPERYTLQELYAPDRTSKPPLVKAHGCLQLAAYVDTLSVMKENLKDSSNIFHTLADLEEVEHEREVENELETVREAKKPYHPLPQKQRPLRGAVREFAESGDLLLASGMFKQVFTALRETAIGRRLRVNDEACSTNLYLTRDFLETIIVKPNQPQDEYSRPVHWVLWSPVTKTALIVSDYEADCLVPVLRHQTPISTHLITYSAPVTKSMLVFDTLDFLSLPALPSNWRAPRWLVRDLGIFAGRLYFDFDRQNDAVRGIMGPPSRSNFRKGDTAENPMELKDDDFEEGEILDEGPLRGAPKVPFSPNALAFMQEWLAVRNKGKDFSRTMMGEICSGRRIVK